MGAIIQKLFAFISRFKKLAIIISSIYLFSFVYLNFLSLYIQIFIYHVMFIFAWFFAFIWIAGSVFSFFVFLFLLPDLLAILKRVLNLLFK